MVHGQEEGVVIVGAGAQGVPPGGVWLQPISKDKSH